MFEPCSIYPLKGPLNSHQLLTYIAESVKKFIQGVFMKFAPLGAHNVFSVVETDCGVGTLTYW